MLTARLIDHVWATRKTDSLKGFKLMLAEVFGGTRAGERLVVADIISAGIGERVVVVTGSAARRMLGDDALPVDAAVIAIIDEDCHLED